MTLALIVLAVLLLLRVPLAFAFAGSSLTYFLTADQSLVLVAQRLNSGLDSFPLAAVPMFMLAGTLMANGGVARRIIDFAAVFVGHRRGGLGHVNVINSVIMGGMSGSGVADAALDAKILVPQMERNGYSRPFAAALSAATGVIAPVLPPGIALVIYGIVAQVSIGRLFLAGIVPGLLMGVTLSVTVAIISRRRGYGGSRERGTFKEIRSITRDASWALMMPVLLIGGLRLGVFTPTELAGVMALYALFLGVFVYRELDWSSLRATLVEAASSASAIMFLLAAGTAFATMVILEQVPQRVAGLILGFTDSPIAFLLLVNIVVLLLGTVLDGLTLTIVVAPILAPIGALLGVDPIHFGIVFIINLMIGALTPPVGILLFTVSSITGVKIGALSREIFPFVLALMVLLLVLTFVPSIVLFIPNLWMP